VAIGLLVMAAAYACSGGSDSTTGPADGDSESPSTEPPVGDDDIDDSDSSALAPGYGGDPVSDSASDPEVIAHAFAPHPNRLDRAGAVAPRLHR
jgi:hypothetical protein